MEGCCQNDQSAGDYSDCRDFVEQEYGKEDAVDGFETGDDTYCSGFDMGQTFNEQGVGDSCEDGSQGEQQEDILQCEFRSPEKEEREQGNRGNQVLIEGQGQAGVIPGEFPIQDGKDGESEA